MGRTQHYSFDIRQVSAPCRSGLMGLAHRNTQRDVAASRCRKLLNTENKEEEKLIQVMSTIKY
jgi:hypothetical protein